MKVHYNMRNVIFEYEKIELLVCIYEISRGLVCKYWISKTTKPTVMLVIFVLHLNPTFVGNIFYSVWKYTSNKDPTKDFVHKKLPYLFLEAPWDPLTNYGLKLTRGFSTAWRDMLLRVP